MGNIGDYIKKARQGRNLTQEQLGKKCGMADSAIRRYESGRGNPTLETLQRIADALEMSLPDLLELERIDKYFSGHDAGDETYKKIAENIEKFHGDKEKMNAAFDTLNAEGKKIARERVEELTEIPRYRRAPQQDTEKPFDAPSEGEGKQ